MRSTLTVGPEGLHTLWNNANSFGFQYDNGVMTVFGKRAFRLSADKAAEFDAAIADYRSAQTFTGTPLMIARQYGQEQYDAWLADDAIEFSHVEGDGIGFYTVTISEANLTSITIDSADIERL